MNYRTFAVIAACAVLADACPANGPLALPDFAVVGRFRGRARNPVIVGHLPSWHIDAESAGTTIQGEQVHRWMTNLWGRTAAGYADLCYGADGWRQLLRAVLERSAQFADPPYTTAGKALWCPRNLPCLVPGSQRSWYPPREMRFAPISGNGDLVPVTGRMADSAITNGFGSLVSSTSIGSRRIRPEHAATCRTMDAQCVSYTLPCVGVVIHRNTDYAHEMAHFFNFPLPDAPFAWKEFLPAFHALKVHAHSLGIDLGAEGGWAQYQARYGTAEAVGELSASAEVSEDGVALLVQYNQSAAGSDVRRWCESASVGRMVL